MFSVWEIYTYQRGFNMAKSTFDFGKIQFRYEVLLIAKKEGETESFIKKTKISTHEDILTFFQKDKSVIFITKVFEWARDENKRPYYKPLRLKKEIQEQLNDQMFKRLKRLKV
jgi:hypothetical protein